MNTETLEQRAERLVRQEVSLCVSSVVATLAGGARRPRQRGRDELMDLSEQAQELAAPVLDYEEAARERGWLPASQADEPFPDTSVFFTDTDGDRNVLPSWEEACAFGDIDPHESEVFEHWAVSDWLAEKLEAKGEKVDRDFASWNVWARTTTGQALSIDAVIVAIVREIMA